MSYDDDEDDESEDGEERGANIVLLRGAAIATVLAAVVAIALVIALNSGGGGSHRTAAASATSTDTTAADPSSPSTATTVTSTVTVTPTGQSGPPGATHSGPASGGPPGSGPTKSPTAGRSTTLAATAPAGFSQVEHAAGHGHYVESRWQDANEYALVDMSPRSGLPPQQAAAGVIDTTSRQPGYHLVSFTPGHLTHSPSAEWIFELPGTERVDFFFSACGHDFGVLGVTTPARFAARLPEFTAMANSVKAC